jgi:tetrapyrrole methylase family protein/MazG family protein
VVEKAASSNSYDRLFELVKCLRGENGCPWDRQQTPESIHPYLVEETYELREAIESGDHSAICEELGDVLFHIFFLARVFEEAEAFTMEDVLDGITEKMIRRHPHVFQSTCSVTDADEVRAQWRRIKAEEAKSDDDDTDASLLDAVPKDLPPLLRAYRLGQEASKVGFDWPNVSGVTDKVEEEFRELRDVLKTHPGGPEISGEFGDLLFSMVNLARFLGVQPDTALWTAIGKFVNRFRFVETRLKARGRSLEEAALTEMDELWEEAKEKASIQKTQEVATSKSLSK